LLEVLCSREKAHFSKGVPVLSATSTLAEGISPGWYINQDSKNGVLLLSSDDERPLVYLPKLKVCLGWDFVMATLL
jgi:hypothetical protein